MNWIKKLFHQHNMRWTSREVIGRTKVDFTVGGIIDIQPATKYLYKGQCLSCKGYYQEIHTIADIFDIEQPYDKG